MANEVEVTLTLNADEAQRVLKQAETGFKNFGDNAGKGLKKADVAFGSFVGNIAAAGVTKAIDAIAGSFGSLIDASADLESISTRFKVLLGDADAAQKQLQDLQQFAATTPFQLPGLADATAQLISFGTNQQDVIPTLRRLGDLAAGAGSSINDLVIPFGRLNSTQKLTLQELDKFADRGINIYGALAERTGVSLASIRDEISKGRVPFQEFIGTIEDFTNEGGIFFEATKAQSETLAGALSTLGDNFFNLQGAIGDTFRPALVSGANQLIDILKELVTFVQENEAGIKAFSQVIVDGLVVGFQAIINTITGTISLFQNFGAIVDRNRGVIDAIAVGLAALGTAYVTLNAGVIANVAVTQGATLALAAYSGALKIAQAAQVVFNAVLTANPIGLVVVAIGAAVTAFVAFNGGIDGAIGKIKELAGIVIQFLAPAIDVTLNSVAALAGIFDSDLRDSVIAAKAEINAFGAELEKSGRAQNQAALAAQEGADAVVDAEAQKREAIAETNTARDNARNKEKEKAQEVFDFEAALAQAKKERVEEEAALDEERATIGAETELERLSELIGEKEALQLQAEANRLAAAGQQAEAEKLIRDKTRKAEQDSIFAVQKFEDKNQKERVNSLKSTFGDISALQRSSNKDAFRIGKAAAIGQATIDGILAVQRALGAAPPPVNFILAGLVGAAQAANLASIASQQPPSFQFGGIVGGQPSNADNQVITAASGEVVLNRNQQTELFNQLNGAGGVGGTGNTVNINVESATGDIPDESIDRIIDGVNQGTEFRNNQLNTGT
jgi:hypothetical protein